MNRVKCLAVSFVFFSIVGITSCRLDFSKSDDNDREESRKPNIIYILADDAGYGDLSCYGQNRFNTPNLDKLAENGIRFTQHYAGSTVCAPSRSSLLTGQHTGHTPIRGNLEVEPEGQHPLSASSLTIAEIMKQAGYVTGAFGKWGLGYPGSEGDPNKQGFDEFFGYNCQRMAHRYYPSYLWHNQERVQMPGNDWKNTVTYAQDVIQDVTLKFIEDQKDTAFFAFVPIVIPHAELIVPYDSIYAKFEHRFKEIPYVGTQGADYGEDLNISNYCSQPKPRAVFASMMYRMDVYVGQIVNRLKELGIDKNTVVMFASDNGPHREGGADPDFFNSNGGLKGYKRDLYEGGIRSPFIVSWPGTIEPGTISDHISAFWDVLPTCADLVGVQTPEEIDGISFLPELLGQEQARHKYLYWEFQEKGGSMAVRLGNWKGVAYHSSQQDKTKFELFDLSNDEKERINMADQRPDIVKEMIQIMNTERTETEEYCSNLPKLIEHTEKSKE
ncbi:arylsulfatase [Marinifilum caeruleilacunae]|uniref:Arylsulfatase n=1 Tax=Marinifilum caeruleilacunae TaxID=2499076 RepID=A0ABX1X044_9BACT|nr:arylsulfatase [Marinifilum caeruleilacunae]NOU61766.1 arylsulfatase [Marinifilum caeruleilacunae]